MNREDTWQRKEPKFHGASRILPFSQPATSRKDLLRMALTWVSLVFILYKGFGWLEEWHASRSARPAIPPNQAVEQAPQTENPTPSSQRAAPLRRQISPPALPSAVSAGKRNVTKCVLNGSVSFTDGDCPNGANRSAITVDVSNVGTVAPKVSVIDPQVAAQQTQNKNQQPQQSRVPMQSKSQAQSAECHSLKLRIEQIDATTRQPLTIQQQEYYRQERRKLRQRESDLGC